MAANLGRMDTRRDEDDRLSRLDELFPLRLRRDETRIRQSQVRATDFLQSPHVRRARDHQGNKRRVQRSASQLAKLHAVARVRQRAIVIDQNGPLDQLSVGSGHKAEDVFRSGNDLRC